MDESISEQVDQFFIKPVISYQIFMACKQSLEKNKLSEEKATTDYLKQFQQIDDAIEDTINVDDWWKLYDRLTDWQIKFDTYKDTGQSVSYTHLTLPTT